jgi:hypothetical protein
MICFICTKKLVREEFTMNPYQSIECTFDAAYGSIHDGDQGVFFICDNCYGFRIDRVFSVRNYIEEG